MTTTIAIYIICGLIFHQLVIRKYKIKKRTIPMWFVHIQLIFGWFPIVIFSAFIQEDDLKSKLNQSIKDSKFIQPLPGIEMPGKDDSNS